MPSGRKGPQAPSSEALRWSGQKGAAKLWSANPGFLWPQPNSAHKLTQININGKHSTLQAQADGRASNPTAPTDLLAAADSWDAMWLMAGRA